MLNQLLALMQEDSHFMGRRMISSTVWAESYECAKGSEEMNDDPLDLGADEILKSTCADADKEYGYHWDDNVSLCW